MPVTFVFFFLHMKCAKDRRRKQGFTGSMTTPNKRVLES